MKTVPQNFDEPSPIEYHWRDDGKFGFDYSRPIEPRPPQVYRPDEWWKERAAAVTRWVEQQEEYKRQITEEWQRAALISTATDDDLNEALKEIEAWQTK
jgi:hypothetical protein